MSKPTREQIAADDRGALERGVASVEERAELFRDDLATLLQKGHKWDAILLGLANQFDADARNLDYGRLLGVLESFQVTYRMTASVLRGLAAEVVVLDQRHRALCEKGKPADDEPADEMFVTLTFKDGESPDTELGRLVVAAAEERCLKIEPLHPGVNDPALARFWCVAVPSFDDGEEFVDAVGGMDAVDGVWLKAHDAPPGGRK